MNEISKHWLAEECRVEDGIYFDDDTYIPMIQNSPQVPRRSIGELLSRSPEGWSGVYPGEPLAVANGFVVLGGETSWEGVGFLAVVREKDESLVWLLHSSGAEAFRSASLVGEALLATSSEYPSAIRWEIPVFAPWNLKVERTDG
jgi:hypothetical protein